MRTNELGKLVPAVTGDELTSSIPQINEIAEITTSQFSNIPSSQMSPELMLALRLAIMDTIEQSEIDGIVVVHGTDTMEETAFFLDASLSNLQLNNKPVILTGAMRSNDQLSADGMANLLGAILVAVDTDSASRGVMIVMNDEIHSARYVRKMDTSSLQTFESPQFTALGKICHTHAGHHLDYHHAAIRLSPLVNVPRETIQLDRVDIVMMFSGADDALIHASISSGAKGIIIQAVGASSVNLEMYRGIEQAINTDVQVVIASRSPIGLCAPVYGYKGGGQTLAELGAHFANDLPAHKARLLAQLCISTKTNLAATFAQLTKQ